MTTDKLTLLPETVTLAKSCVSITGVIALLSMVMFVKDVEKFDLIDWRDPVVATVASAFHFEMEPTFVLLISEMRRPLYPALFVPQYVARVLPLRFL